MSEEPHKKRSKFPVRLLLTLLLFLALIFAGYKAANWFKLSKELKIEETSQAILDRIEKVSKLITVEGYFSEIYDYKDYYWYDLSPFRKKALIRVKAKVSMGMDFEGLKIVADEATKTVVINSIPEVEILSIDHDADYYDITEGSFNSFSEKDYNELQKNAKEYIRNVALKSDLVDSAKEQKEEFLELIKFYLESVGWKLILKKSPIAELPN